MATPLNREIIRLSQFESRAVVGVQTLAPDTYEVVLNTQGNSLLSTIYIESGDPGATVKVNYWDFGPGNGDTPGQRIDLQGHNLLAAAGAPVSDRIIVTGMHDKPRIEIIVTGGTVRLGVYISVVSTFASDLDQNLKLNGQDADLSKDKGLVVSGYDAADDKFYFLPLENGGVKISGSLTISELTGAVYTKETIDVADTEKEVTLPDGTRKFILRARTPSKVLLAATTGDIAAGRYITVNAGVAYTSQQFAALANRKIFLQSSDAGLDVEFENWY